MFRIGAVAHLQPVFHLRDLGAIIRRPKLDKPDTNLVAGQPVIGSPDARLTRRVSSRLNSQISHLNACAASICAMHSSYSSRVMFCSPFVGSEHETKLLPSERLTVS